MKRTVLASILILSAIFVFSTAHALPTASFDIGGGNPYFDDYDIFIGVGDPNNPIWEIRVATKGSGGDPSDADGNGTFDISASPVLWGQTWFLEVDDNWGINSSYIQSFSIDTGEGIFSAENTPIHIPDNALRYAFIDLPTQGQAPVPEPATMVLFGCGLIGLLGFKIKRRK